MQLAVKETIRDRKQEAKPTSNHKRQTPHCAITPDVHEHHKLSQKLEPDTAAERKSEQFLPVDDDGVRGCLIAISAALLVTTPAVKGKDTLS